MLLSYRGVHPPKPMMHIAFSPISTKFTNSSYFCQIYTFPPYFRKIYKFFVFLPNLYISPLFPQNLRSLCLIYIFASTYFDHGAFMHQALHVAYWTPCKVKYLVGLIIKSFTARDRAILIHAS